MEPLSGANVMRSSASIAAPTNTLMAMKWLKATAFASCAERPGDHCLAPLEERRFEIGPLAAHHAAQPGGAFLEVRRRRGDLGDTLFHSGFNAPHGDEWRRGLARACKRAREYGHRLGQHSR